MKNLVIVGNGGFAREVEWLVKRINAVTPTWNFLGFVDDTSGPKGWGNDEDVINSTEELYVAISIGTSPIREKIYNRYKTNPNIKFANLIDPSVLYDADSVKFGEGNIICAGTIITVDITIGNCNIINLDCTVGHDAVIGDCVTINPSVNVSGNVTIGSGANIGTGTNIIQGKTIGANTVVGAGAVVSKDLPADVTAVGIPAKVIKENK